MEVHPDCCFIGCAFLCQATEVKIVRFMIPNIFQADNTDENTMFAFEVMILIYYQRHSNID